MLSWVRKSERLVWILSMFRRTIRLMLGYMVFLTHHSLKVAFSQQHSGRCEDDVDGWGRTFLNSYRSVELLNSHMPFTFGSSNGSCGRQYSTKPDWSAETTVS